MVMPGAVCILWHIACEVDCVSNVMAHVHKPDFVFRGKG